ncbi:MAG: MnhB domain-containing protein [candidate division NC10 bacterium]|jgi:multicomponent Na+:H+ antiporter subunit B
MRRPTTIIAEVVTRFAFPIIFLFSLYLLLAGHNNPGGGFIAGLMTAVALVLQYVVFGMREVQRVTPSSYLGLVALGLTLALGTGLGSLVLGWGFLKSGILHLQIPLFGEVEVVSAFVFDVGVYFIVVGVTLTVISLLGREPA